MSTHPDGHPTLTLRGGGWVLVAMALVIGAFLLWATSGVFMAERPVGRGSDPSTYGFTLEPMLADRTYLVGSGNPRDFLVSLDRPDTIRGAEVLRWNSEHRRKLVVPTDRVAGIVVNGEARAYPLSILNAHEVVNDVVGGVPVAVTFSPLTDSLVAFDRRVGGVERTFHVSGLLLNSNLVMYDRPAGAPGSRPPTPGPRASGASWACARSRDRRRLAARAWSRCPTSTSPRGRCGLRRGRTPPSPWERPRWPAATRS